MKCGSYSFRFLVFFLVLVATGGVVTAEGISYVTLPQSLIEKRLHSNARKSEDRHETLQELFRSVGCTADSLAAQNVGGAREDNIICTMPGETDSVIVVGAHFDKAPIGDGVVDNWSGAALLPSLYESLHQHSRRHTFVFVGFAGEERGLLGSKIYVKKLRKEGRARVRAMVNIDSVGLGPTMVWTSHSDKLLLEHLLLTASFLKLPVGGVDVERVGAGDHFPFRQKKIPCAVIHSVTQETLPILHSTDDNLEAIQLDDYYDTYQLLRTYLAYIDSKLEILP